jgi:hypothetical protein
MLPAVYAKSYAELSSWLWFNDDWNWTGTPIVMYLQNSGKQATKAAVAEGAFWEALAKANKGKSLRYVKTFNFDDYDYIPTSIHRTFIGKACPWEIQETIQLASSIGLIDETTSKNIAATTSAWIAADSSQRIGVRRCRTWPSQIPSSRPGSRRAVFGQTAEPGQT